ncbi:MAG: bifunctional demethylmenaquinone methyltransferase/2-methoxy-6-polyprenyl-1,4-benzoquinol methylase UbiE [Chitinophagales bacterium]|nr:bifunctional demethylmenaquinone methyltransferase/2-methoxy-6-polyprenyl-1,4-benzoquinol methylase UbiE [Chitinophagales bacterium]
MAEIKPYHTTLSKKQEVEQMFDAIAPKYDLLNSILSFGVDKGWRKRVIRILKQLQPHSILDVATGTGDLVIAMAKSGLQAEKFIGFDLSEQMLNFGKTKIHQEGLSEKIEMVKGDGEKMPFQTGMFDAVTASFGVRNFGNLKQGLSEMHRVLRPNGDMLILEFSKPTNKLFKSLYYFYFCNVLPLIGKLVSKDARAYTYLPESVDAFPSGKDFVVILEEIGFKNIQCIPLTFGISTIYWAKK